MLSVEVEGDPEPTVYWAVDDEEVFEDDGIAFTQEGQMHSLVFKETVEEDEGIYQCVAKNAHGEVSCTAKFLINEEAVEPEFVQKMKHIEIMEGSEARFEIEVSGSPCPEVTWFKKKEKLVESDKYNIVSEGLMSSLTVLNCVSSDAGVFQAVAENSAGKISSNAQLTVLEKVQPPAIEKAKDFYSEIQVKTGERFATEFKITGVHAEKVLLRNGSKVVFDDRVKITEEGDKVILVFEKLEEIDGGSYELIVENSGGKTAIDFSLAVEGKSSVTKVKFVCNLRL